MNEGDSAGGGHQGLSPAPPAVPDRRFNLSTTTTTTTTNNQQTTPTSLSNKDNSARETTTTTRSATFNALEAQSLATKTNTPIRGGGVGGGGYQQVFTHHQQQLQQKQRQQLQQQQALASLTSGGESAVINTLSVANNHMQQNSAQYVAGVAAAVAASTTTATATAVATTTTTAVVSNTQQQQHILVTQIQTSTISSYASAATTPATATATTTIITTSNRTFLSTTTTTAAAPTSNLATKHPASLDTAAAASLTKRLKLDAATTDSSSVVAGASVVGAIIGGSLLPAITSINEKRSVSKAAIIPPHQDVITIRKLVIDQKYLRLKSIKEKYSDHVAELFYLQSGGNMMDYQTWKKKPPSPQYINFCNAYRLDQLVNEEIVAVSSGGVSGAAGNAAAAQPQQTAEHIATIIGVSGGGGGGGVAAGGSSSQTQQQPQSSLVEVATKTNPQSQLPGVTTATTTTTTAHPSLKRKRSLSTPPTAVVVTTPTFTTAQTPLPDSGPCLPQGAEIKIPAVGATPVAVSTQLPAAVVQLSQQGGTPLVPCETISGTSCLRRNGNGLVEPLSTNAQSPAVPCLVPTTALQQHFSTSASTAAGVGGTAAGGGGGATHTFGTATNAASTNASSEAAGSAGVSGGGASGTATTASANTPNNTTQEFSFKAKQEVYVMQRISELQREGLWTEKRLPKLQEPSRPKAHWDYLLEEMVWLAADFAQERKWKKNAAKKCAKMVQKYFQDKANAAQKAEKAQELHLKRIASFISKEVKMFWSNVEKLVEYKHHTKIEEKRKQALDQHLSFIVDQTEKFSQQLAEGMNKSLAEATTTTAAAASTVPSINSSRISSPKREETNASDDEFRPASSSEDDEETIAKAEEEAADVNEEVAALEKESQMDLDDFLNDLPPGYLENRDKLVEAEKMEVNDGAEEETDDDEFQANEASEDDENTISQQEAEESELDHKKELDELEADNDLTVEELMAKYQAKRPAKAAAAATAAASSSKPSRMEIDSDDDEEAHNSDDASTEVSDDNSEEDEEEEDEDEQSSDESQASLESDNDGNDDKAEDHGLKSLLEDKDETNKDDMIKDAAALAESIQPKGNTLSSTNVVTPVPMLLKHKLREYQHIGLDWLVTMHDRKLNGILADEMGLGKTIQTIALLAHLACVKGNWGPHLIVVPSSVMLNWEMEFKKWCPGFKILTYYGTQKERKMKRVGWTKPNAFHVCITSYKLVVQDQQSFRRKKWKYLILDEAQNIKNFKSQRWQLLLNFSTERRLLLTGTPLQNDLMELWSLMHFLMPYVFSSHREFKEWFSNPMTGMIEGNMEYNESLINRLHKVIRPFLLRRLKKEVEKQMPKKYEHVVMCRLSNRQRYLYDDFMSRSKTRETLQTGNLLSVINVLMQLRKVCNHPNMFEVRPTISPFQMEGISYQTARLVFDIFEYDPFKHINLESLNLLLCQLELTLTAYVSHKSRLLAPPRKLIEEIDIMPEPPPRCPPGKYKFHIRIRDPKVQKDLSTHSSSSVRVGASPAMKTDGSNKLVPIHNSNTLSNRIKNRVNNIINPINNAMRASLVEEGSSSDGKVKSLLTAAGQSGTKSDTTYALTPASTTTTATTAKIAKLMQSGKPYFLLTPAVASGGGESGGGAVGSGGTGGRLTLVCKTSASSNFAKSDKTDANEASNKSAMLVTALAQSVKDTTETTEANKSAADKAAEQKKKQSEDDASSELDPLYNMTELLQKRKEKRASYLKLMSRVNKRRVEAVPIYGEDCRAALEKFSKASELVQFSTWQTRGYTNCRTAMERADNWTLGKLLKSYERRCEELRLTFGNFVIYVPSVRAPSMRFYVQHLCSQRLQQQRAIEATITREISPKLALLHPIISAMTTQFPDPRLIQYDCGKLQTLDRLLRQLKSGQHRVLIFTQMTKMLDVLEAFLNYHGHIYLRLDGSTRVEQRQVLMERFNGDKRIFCFILSTRSGGVGVNLTGADTVIFYDSDWNPTMDAQAQDRCHRIGQTRDVHIYRLVSEKTIEVNILKKANQKRMLSDMAIEGGNFTTTYFKSSTIKDLFNLEQPAERSGGGGDVDGGLSVSKQAATDKMLTEQRTVEVVETEKQSLRAFESALAAAEDEQDVQATKTARAEVAADLAEFDENIPIDDVATAGDGSGMPVEMSRADLEVQNLVKQLSPIERYAMRFVEETGAAWTAEQLRAAEEELEAQKREWEANRQAALLKEEEMLKQESLADEMITYSRKDATNQVNKSQALLKKNRKIRTKATTTTSKKLVRNKEKVAAASAKTRTKTTRTTAAAKRITNRQKMLRPNKKNLTIKRKNINSGRRRRRRKSSSSGSGISKNGVVDVEDEDEEDDAASDSDAEEKDEEEKDDDDDEEQDSEEVEDDDNDENENENEEDDDEEDAGEHKRNKSGRDNKTKLAKRRKPKVMLVDPIRKTTRTSMAAAAAAAVTTTTEEIELRNSSNNNSPAKQTPEKKANAESLEKTPVKNATGVKNQKLLSISKKRRRLMKQRTAGLALKKRKLNPAPVEKKAANKVRFIARRRSTVTNSRRLLRNNSAKKVNAAVAQRTGKKRKTAYVDSDTNAVDDDDNEHEENDANDESDDDDDEHEHDNVEDDNDNENEANDNADDANDDAAEHENEQQHEQEATADDSADSADDEPHHLLRGGHRSALLAKAKNSRLRERVRKNIEPEKCITPDSKYSLDEQTTTNSNSMDVWDPHAQIHDTATTNSTYYNVSEESDSDEATEAASVIQMNSTLKKSTTPVVNSSAHQRSLTRSPGNANSTITTTSSTTPANTTLPATQQNQIDVNSPRTRSRGSVKINLWTLDVSPVLPGVKPQLPKHKKETIERPRKIIEEDPLKTTCSEDDVGGGGGAEEEQQQEEQAAVEEAAEEEQQKSKAKSKGTISLSSTLRSPASSTKRIVKRRNLKRVNQAAGSSGGRGRVMKQKANNSNTLHRWLLKTPKVMLNNVDAVASTSGSEQHSDEEAPTAAKKSALANGPS